MKLDKLLTLLIVIAVGYLLYREIQRNKSNTTQIAGTGSEGNPVKLELEMGSSPFAQTFTVKSVPKRFPVAKPTNGELMISTAITNAGDVYIADSYGSAEAGIHRFMIEAGNLINLGVTNLADWYYYGTADDIFSIAGEVENFA